jgi:hypothetical protein
MNGHFWNLHVQVLSSCSKPVAHGQKPPVPSMPRHPGLIPSCRRPAAPMEHFLPSRGRHSRACSTHPAFGCCSAARRPRTPQTAVFQTHSSRRVWSGSFFSVIPSNSKVSHPAWLSWPERGLSLLPGQRCQVRGRLLCSMYRLRDLPNFSRRWVLRCVGCGSCLGHTEQESIDRCPGGLVPTKRR